MKSQGTSKIPVIAEGLLAVGDHGRRDSQIVIVSRVWRLVGGPRSSRCLYIHVHIGKEN